MKPKIQYVARKAGKYNGRMYRPGEVVELVGAKWDEILIEQAHGIQGVAQPFLKAVPVEEFVTTGDYDAFTVRQLREMCKEKGLPIYGKKSDLVERLEGRD